MHLLDLNHPRLLMGAFSLKIFPEPTQIFSRLESQQSQVSVKIAIFFGETQGFEALLNFALQFHYCIDGFDADPDHSRIGKLGKHSQPTHLKIKGGNLPSRLLQNLCDPYDLILFDIAQKLKGQMNGTGFRKPSLQVQSPELSHNVLTTLQNRFRDSNSDEGTQG